MKKIILVIIVLLLAANCFAEWDSFTEYSEKNESIPKEYGRLVNAETAGSVNESYLWFESPDGTIRMVTLTLKKRGIYVLEKFKDGYDGVYQTINRK
jgi:hypothetical protein